MEERERCHSFILPKDTIPKQLICIYQLSVWFRTAPATDEPNCLGVGCMAKRKYCSCNLLACELFSSHSEYWLNEARMNNAVDMIVWKFKFLNEIPNWLLLLWWYRRFASKKRKTKEWQFSFSSMDVEKGDLRTNSSYTWDRLRTDGDGFTTCHVCSIPHS
jgi:hypothetical protein